MKKFLVKIVTFVLILSAILGGVNEWYKVMPHYDYYGVGIGKFENIPNNIEICNLGSSHGFYGYNYANYESTYNCFNFGLPSQTLSYDYRLLDYYQDYLSEDCTVFITLSYFSFIGIDETETGSFESKNKRYYQILDKEHIKMFSSKYSLLINYLPCLCVEPNILIYTLLGKNYSSTTDYRTADQIDLNSDKRTKFESHLVDGKIDEYGNYIINQEEVDALYDILELCNVNHYHPIFITTPYLSEYTSTCEELAPNGVALFYQMVDKISTETGVAYYDFSHDERFSGRYDLFRDSDHMNVPGSLVFTDVLMQEVFGNF